MKAITFFSRAIFVVLAMTWTSGIFSQTTSGTVRPVTGTTATSEKETPATFPVIQNTGNPEADNANYRAAKKAWVTAHPEEYVKMLPEGSSLRTSDEKTTITHPGDAIPASRSGVKEEASPSTNPSK